MLSGRISALLLIAVLLPNSSLLARSDDRDQPANIEADRAVLDDLKQVSVYTGNVIFTQGTTRITGEQVTVYTQDGKLQRVLVEGKPAKFRQLDDEGKQIRAEGFEMEYRSDDAHLRLEGKAALYRPGESFTSERIDYYVYTKTVEAGPTGNSKSGRVRIVIQPQRIRSE